MLLLERSFGEENEFGSRGRPDWLVKILLPNSKHSTTPNSSLLNFRATRKFSYYLHSCNCLVGFVEGYFQHYKMYKEWEINIWLAKNIGKYHVWLWSSRVKILDSSWVAVRSRVINLIFSQVMTITTSDIFQYFCQPYNNYIHKFVVKWPYRANRGISVKQ